MTHRHIQKQLSAYLDGELNDRMRAKIELHLHTCSECADIVADLERTRLQFAQFRQPTPAGIWQSVQVQMGEQPRIGTWDRIVETWQAWFLRPLPVGIGVFVTACLVLGLFYLQPTQKVTEDPLEMYVMLHDGYTTQTVSAGSNLDGYQVANATAAAESELPDDVQILLDAYLGNIQ